MWRVKREQLKWQMNQNCYKHETYEIMNCHEQRSLNHSIESNAKKFWFCVQRVNYRIS